MAVRSYAALAIGCNYRRRYGGLLQLRCYNLSKQHWVETWGWPIAVVSDHCFAFLLQTQLNKCTVITACPQISIKYTIFNICAQCKKKKKELSQRDLALSLCCLGRIRTLTGGTRIRRATITPQGIVFLLLRCKVMHFFRICQIFSDFFIIKLYARYYSAIYQPYIFFINFSCQT